MIIQKTGFTIVIKIVASLVRPTVTIKPRTKIAAATPKLASLLFFSSSFTMIFAGMLTVLLGEYLFVVLRIIEESDPLKNIHVWYLNLK